ncbi:uncharacterized protein LOC133839205 [Drosophila sulfurigaster albostrigata]|uniref:uncharacterized protein LOC133839205 n=1 Tax=Drosophila sulfurigaster albostrigata TaxID=89887 RepID=UPI002D21CC2A|nr:uncharacterized protein LOC133839205 [Drosophila sulfurigaster albostrigata]
MLYDSKKIVKNFVNFVLQLRTNNAKIKKKAKQQRRNQPQIRLDAGSPEDNRNGDRTVETNNNGGNGMLLTQLEQNEIDKMTATWTEIMNRKNGELNESKMKVTQLELENMQLKTNN